MGLIAADVVLGIVFHRAYEKHDVLQLVLQCLELSAGGVCRAVVLVRILPQAFLLARLLWRINRDYFKPDLELIARVKDPTDATDLKAEFHD